VQDKKQCNFRLGAACLDALDEIVTILKERDTQEGYYWRKRNRTDAIEFAAECLLSQLRKEKEKAEAKAKESAKPADRVQQGRTKNVPGKHGKVAHSDPAPGNRSRPKKKKERSK
jgi:hypothetical protein